jgi:hypothetical protein
MSVDALKANYQEQMLKAKSMFSKKGVAVAPAAPSAP